MNYDLSLDVIDSMVKPGMRVLVQLPAGLRGYFLSIAQHISDLGAEPIFWAGSCYGACDLPVFNAELASSESREEERLSSSATYGACDLPAVEAKQDRGAQRATCDLPVFKDVDLLIHFGHDEFKS